MSDWHLDEVGLTKDIVLSHFQAETLLAARKQGRQRVLASFDLGLTQTEALLNENGIRILDGPLDTPCLSWRHVERIAESDNGCFLVEDGGVWRIKLFSETSNCLYSLMPTSAAPTMLVSGVPMHRIKGIDPREDTLRKIATLAPFSGSVLDTTTGLGYTAIEAARTADCVITVEIEATVMELASYNPWSRRLFTDERITRRVGDVAALVETLADGAFDIVIHDPPVFSLAGELYGLDFHRQLYRVLRPGGRMYHYIGDLNSRLGRSVARGTAARLRDAGFARVVPQPEAFGLRVDK